MNIHFNPAILMWTEGVQGFDTLPWTSTILLGVSGGPTRYKLLQSEPFEVVKWPFLGFSDLKLVVEKVTLKNQVYGAIWLVVI
jgi:hypothetical protein